MNIGRRTGGFYFNGMIDEVRIYNRALTQSEIQADMNTPVGNGGFEPTSTGSHAEQFQFGFRQSGDRHGKRPRKASSSDEHRRLTAGDWKHRRLRRQQLRLHSIQQLRNLPCPKRQLHHQCSLHSGRRRVRGARRVTIADNAPGNPHTIGLTGTGTASAGLSISPRVSALTFTRTQQFNASQQQRSCQLVSRWCGGRIGGFRNNFHHGPILAAGQLSALTR